MSLSSALSNAVTGLGAAGRSAQTISSNVANALTEGYGRREVVTGADRFGGVRVVAVSRNVDPALLQGRRQSDAAQGFADVTTGMRKGVADLLGEAGSGASLSGRVAKLEAQLVEAASMPSSALRLQGVATAARDLAAAVNRAADGVQALRLKADAGIARDVETLNTGLQRIERLNAQIVATKATGGDANGLLDQRAQLVDGIAGIVPLRAIQRDNGTMALMTVQGQMLLDHRAVPVTFVAANAMDADATLAGGPLSGLVVGGTPVAAASRFGGGTLAARFDARDGLGPEAQQQLDAFARDLVDRFETPAADPTRAATDAGLFTDAQNLLNPLALNGLAGRLALNVRVDPAGLNEVWRLRDGLGALLPGPSGQAAGLQALSDALAVPRPATAPNLTPIARSAGRLADDLMSLAGGAAFRAEEESAFVQARTDSLRQQELSNGVDTDQEMQKLLLVEQAYGANTRVVQAVDEMLERLLRI